MDWSARFEGEMSHSAPEWSAATCSISETTFILLIEAEI